MTRAEVFHQARLAGLKVIDYDGEDRHIELVSPTLWQAQPFTELAGRTLLFPLGREYGYGLEQACRLERAVIKIPTEDEGDRPVYLYWYVPIPPGYELKEPEDA